MNTVFTFKATNHAGAESRDFTLDVAAWFARLPMEARLEMAESFIRRQVSVGTKDAKDGTERFAMIGRAFADYAKGLFVPADFARKARAARDGVSEVGSVAADARIAQWCDKLDKVPGLVKNTTQNRKRPSLADYLDAARAVPAMAAFVVAKGDNGFAWDRAKVAAWVMDNDSEAWALAVQTVEASRAVADDVVITLDSLTL